VVKDNFFIEKKVEKYIYLYIICILNLNRRIWQIWAPAKFLIGMVFLEVLISAGGHVVLKRRNGSTWGREMYSFGGGQSAFGRGKWCIWMGEMVYLSKREPTLNGNVLPCYALKLSNLLLSKAIGTIQGKEKTVLDCGNDGNVVTIKMI